MAAEVLVITRDPGLRRLLEARLADDGVVPVFCDRVAGCHDRIRDEQPEVILLEIGVTDMNAHWRLLEELHWDPATRSIPVILIAQDLLALQRLRRVVPALATAVLTTPTDHNQLRQVLRRRLAQPALVG